MTKLISILLGCLVIFATVSVIFLFFASLFGLIIWGIVSGLIWVFGIPLVWTYMKSFVLAIVILLVYILFSFF